MQRVLRGGQLHAATRLHTENSPAHRGRLRSEHEPDRHTGVVAEVRFGSQAGISAALAARQLMVRERTFGGSTLPLQGLSLS